MSIKPNAFSYFNQNGLTLEPSAHFGLSRMNGRIQEERAYSFTDMNGFSGDERAHFSYQNMNGHWL